MKPACPSCERHSNHVIDSRTVVRYGTFRRKSDSRCLERFRCLTCRKTFSSATRDQCVRQKKRQKNRRLFELLASGVSQRRAARLERISRKTVARRLIFFGGICDERLLFDNAQLKVEVMQFDDLETFELTKCKPVSVTLAVEERTRKILGFEVAQMSEKGRLSKKARRKYGFRRDERARGRRALFKRLQPIIADGAIIKSDSNPYYPKDVREYFPNCTHVTFLGKRGASTGQGELKKTLYDPIFSLNHTCAMFRANVARLIRKTWCTTKKKERLRDHLAIYAVYHNRYL